jgi:hypothetical protein
MTATRDVALRRAVTRQLADAHDTKVAASQQRFRAKHQRKMDCLAAEIAQLGEAREAIKSSMNVSSDSGSGGDTSHCQKSRENKKASTSSRFHPGEAPAKEKGKDFYVACYDYCRGDGVVCPPPSGIADTPRYVRNEADRLTALFMSGWRDEDVERMRSRRSRKEKQAVSLAAPLPELWASRLRVLGNDPKASYWDSVVAADRLRRAKSSML